jgi:predicted ATPase/DNA-binding NarL/FixJ family response regulator
METAAGARQAVPSRPPGQLQNLTSFIGRETEMRSLTNLLLRGSRLVTIVGTGGVGKTRLAAELVRNAAGPSRDGVWWIDLSGAADVVGAVVTSAGLRGRGVPLDVITSWFQVRHAVLVLDNCEHLVAAAAAFCHAALDACPGLTILATSREPLGVQGEVRWLLKPLTDGDAAQLFDARAALVRPDFKPTADRATVLSICARLDRLPLAIEMAAARLDVMSESEVLANLNDRFQILASSLRFAPERQLTMTAAIDWSYRLLDEDEARLFRRLAVFQGGFTIEAADLVCGQDGATPTLAVLSGLVRKSMVVADPIEGGTRYRLLESHRDYALDKMRGVGELAEIRGRHYGYFRTQHWTPQESANFWSALTWANDQAADGGLELALEIGDSDWSNQARVLGLIVELTSSPALDERLRIRAAMMAARLEWRSADLVSSQVHARSAVELARRLGDPELIAQALMTAGLVREATGDIVEAGEIYDQALALLRTSTNWRLVADHTNARALLWIVQGDPARARDMLLPVVDIARSRGDKAGLAQFLESLASAQLDIGDVDGAAASWNESLGIFIVIDDWFGIIWSLVGLSLVATTRGEYERALRLHAAADRLSREYALGTWSFRADQLLAARKQATARLGKSKAEAAWARGEAMVAAEALEYAQAAPPAAGEPADAGPLSKREREVALMVAAGMTNREIAQKLFIAERTAEGHVERIRNKLGVRSRTEVATWAVSQGLKSPLDKP